MSDSLRSHGLYPTRLLHPWDSPDSNTGVGCHFLLQKIFPTQGSNLGLPYCRQTLYLPSEPPRKSKKKKKSTSDIIFFISLLLFPVLPMKKNWVSYGAVIYASVYILWNYVLENYSYWDIHNKMRIVLNVEKQKFPLSEHVENFNNYYWWNMPISLKPSPPETEFPAEFMINLYPNLHSLSCLACSPLDWGLTRRREWY